jgi:hypothetical protein
MIYCNLKGGLGNMLFQIAAAKSIAIDNETDCYFPNLTHHLQVLNNDMEYNPKLNYSHDYLMFLKNLNVKSLPNTPILKLEYPFHFFETPPIKNDTLINGFFQSEKYFVKNREEIIKYLSFDFIQNDYIKNKYPFILNKRCTSIHVRRGDYLRYQNHHPTQSLEYYMKGVDILKDKTDLFVIFSDDIEWCKQNIKIENSVYITDEKDYIELYLMTLCENNITSNSSFSWWGGWLNNNPKKIVIGPKIWFGSAIQHNTGDIIPEKWIKI